MNDLRVLIVADDPLVRTGLAASLSSQPNLTIVDQVAGDAQLSGQSLPYDPDAVLWDLGWEPGPTLEANLEQLSELADAGLPVVALLPDETRTAEVWAAGVRGLLFRDTQAELLAAALRAVALGLAVLEAKLAARVLPPSGRAGEPLIEELTAREMDVLQLLADGLTNRAIAQRLGISEHTVKFHINAILGKLGAQSRTEAVVRASRLGLIIL